MVHFLATVMTVFLSSPPAMNLEIRESGAIAVGKKGLAISFEALDSPLFSAGFGETREMVSLEMAVLKRAAWHLSAGAGVAWISQEDDDSLRFGRTDVSIAGFLRAKYAVFSDENLGVDLSARQSIAMFEERPNAALTATLGLTWN